MHSNGAPLIKVDGSTKRCLAAPILRRYKLSVPTLPLLLVLLLVSLHGLIFIPCQSLQVGVVSATDGSYQFTVSGVITSTGGWPRAVAGWMDPGWSLRPLTTLHSLAIAVESSPSWSSTLRYGTMLELEEELDDELDKTTWRRLVTVSAVWVGKVLGFETLGHPGVHTRVGLFR